MKLWDKGTATLADVERFTVGRDREMDIYLAKWDVLGSLAHTQMLESIGLLTKEELTAMQTELKNIYKEIEAGQFSIEDGVEDVHSQVEVLLTQRIGEAGKKIHSGRSRNDQVLTDIKLFVRNELQEITALTGTLFYKLIELSDQHKDILIPGYTHLQVAMPSSFGLWFGSYAESLIDDMELMLASYNIANKNPLGSGAGYGGSFPLNRTLITELLGFETMNYNVVYAQMTRGKTEKAASIALSSIAATLSKLSYDACLYMSQNFGFISFPDELTTGSSIMPHKKNPDVWELIRAKCNVLQALPQQFTLLTNNLPSGYFRDLQLTKELLFPAFDTIKDCINITLLMLNNISVNKNILADERYKHLFSVEVMNKLVLDGVPLRDAYKQIGADIASGTFKPSKEVNHTHEGSIGNLCNDKISGQMQKVLQQFSFEKVNAKTKALLQ